MDLPNTFDLVAVDYNKHGAGRGLCIAPPWELSEGDEIETNAGRGVVMGTCFCSANDGVFKLISNTFNLDKVCARIVPINYKGE